MLSPTALTTRDNLKTALGILLTDSSKDQYLDDLINRATRRIESVTERKLKARRYNGNTATPPSNVHPTTNVTDEDYIYFSGTPRSRGGDTDYDQGHVFYLPAWPVQANSVLTFTLESLSTRTSAGETWSTELTEFSDYIVDRPNGVLRLIGGAFNYGVRNYRITCSAGFLEPVSPYVPYDLEHLCIEVTKKMYREEAGVTSEKIGTWAKTYDVASSQKQIDEMIANFKRWSL